VSPFAPALRSRIRPASNTACRCGQRLAWRFTSGLTASRRTAVRDIASRLLHGGKDSRPRCGGGVSYVDDAVCQHPLAPALLRVVQQHKHWHSQPPRVRIVARGGDRRRFAQPLDIDLVDPPAGCCIAPPTPLLPPAAAADTLNVYCGGSASFPTRWTFWGTTGGTNVPVLSPTTYTCGAGSDIGFEFVSDKLTQISGDNGAAMTVTAVASTAVRGCGAIKAHPSC
jgi:hypothetical protein